jgi:hypothetical protein
MKRGNGGSASGSGDEEGEKRKLTGGVHMSVASEREADEAERRNQKGKPIHMRAPMAHRPGGPAR